MGKRGIAPKPTALRLVAGERKSRINTNEPIPEEGLPLCPMEASPDVHEVWSYTLHHLDVMGILTLADRDALYVYCEAVVVHRDASRILAREGMLAPSTSGRGSVRHPAHQIQRDAAQTMRSFAQEFGLTPSARSTIKLHVKDSNKEQGASRLLSG